MEHVLAGAVLCATLGYLKAKYPIVTPDEAGVTAAIGGAVRGGSQICS